MCFAWTHLSQEWQDILLSVLCQLQAVEIFTEMAQLIAAATDGLIMEFM